MPVEETVCFAVLLWNGLKPSIERLNMRWPSSAGPGKKGCLFTSHRSEKIFEDYRSEIRASESNRAVEWHASIASSTPFLDNMWPSQHLRSWWRYFRCGVLLIRPPPMSHSFYNGVLQGWLSGVCWYRHLLMIRGRWSSSMSISGSPCEWLPGPYE